jgi:hypothetical protein
MKLVILALLEIGTIHSTGKPSEEWFGEDIHDTSMTGSTNADEWSTMTDSDSSSQISEGEDALSEIEKTTISEVEEVISGLDDFSSMTGANVTGRLIYTCGGTSKELSYCQFPFTTLAGNTYTTSCADQVEDNPDISTDRPWCFVSATEWGFCDCESNFDFTYITFPHNSTAREIAIQATIDYPSRIWCNLQSANDTSLVGTGGPHGGSANMTNVMIWRSMAAQINFIVPIEYMRSHTKIVCQAQSDGLLKQPDPVSVLLGSNTRKPTDDDEDDDEDAKDGLRLITRTNGATVYSVVIVMIVVTAIGVRLALDARKKLMFTLINDEEDNNYANHGHPLKVMTK